MARIRVRPSKTQSIVGFIVGLIFVGVGFVLVLPNGGLFAYVWTLMAIIITVVNGLNAFTDKGVASHVINADIEVLDSDENYDFADKLRELESLYNEGLISNQEYNEKRKEILDKKW